MARCFLKMIRRMVCPDLRAIQNIGEAQYTLGMEESSNGNNDRERCSRSETCFNVFIGLYIIVISLNALFFLLSPDQETYVF
jgi:hypothetical protein